MSDKFFSQTHCDRCNKELIARTMSWFTTETICMECSTKENGVKKDLRSRGIKDAMEGCGFIPPMGNLTPKPFLTPRGQL